jgi:anhydro-N-acetylmuramic acid kinase
VTKPLCALGLMSGTSMDGIDVAMITTDGEGLVERGPSATYDYPADFRAKLRQANSDAAPMTVRTDRPGCLTAVETELTERHAEAVRGFLAGHKIDAATIDIIGFHGQTVLHKPEARLTVQLGDGPLLANMTSIDVVYDLRAADVAAHGQGAPLVPIYHRALAASAATHGSEDRAVGFLNIGGVGNVTYIERDGTFIAFDTGPGNALIDDWVGRHTGQAFDADGRHASAGFVSSDVLETLMANLYFAEPPPKSLDRNTFKIDAVRTLSLEDGAATLTAFTAQAVRRANDWFPEQPSIWIVCGGGRHNRTLMKMLEAELARPVVEAESYGFNGSSMEAEAWAYLAVRSLRGLPITFPMTTGVPAPMTGGVLARGAR